MITILENYVANEDTLAIFPAKAMAYSAIVLETNQTLHIRQTPLDIIKGSCLAYWSTYDGRKLATIHHTGNKYKTPIVICPTKRLFAFPTHAPKEMDCSWIFYEKVWRTWEGEKRRGGSSLIQFTNGKTTSLDISLRSLQAQMERTWECVSAVGGGY